MTKLDAEAALILQTPTKLATLAKDEDAYVVSSSMRTGLGGTIVEIWGHRFDDLDEAHQRFNDLAHSMAPTLPVQSTSEGSGVLPAAIGLTADGDTVTIVCFGEDRWIGFDSLDPDGIYAEWTSVSAALSELFDLVFNP